MKKDDKIKFVDDWRASENVGPDAVIDDLKLDSMWEFARTNANSYEGLQRYCMGFNDSFLARAMKRTKMRAMLEVRVAAVVDMGTSPSLPVVKVVKIPKYVGTGSKTKGSFMVPVINVEGEMTPQGRRIMLDQAVKQMHGHRNRYHEVMPEDTLAVLDGYIEALTKAANLAVVKAKAG